MIRTAKHHPDHPWAGICLAPGCAYGHDVLEAEERSRIAQAWLATDGWEWQCAGCHRPVPPMGMCETCGVFGIMRLVER